MDSRVGFPRKLAPVVALMLVAATAAGGEPAGARIQGVQVWTASPLVKVRLGDGPPAGAKSPGEIALAGCRNGAFSWQVVVGSGAPIRGLRAAASGLKGADGASLPAGAVELRYARLDGPGNNWRIPLDFHDGLEPEPPAEVPVPKDAASALAPVWVTVRVPRDARAGRYSGKVTVAAAGLDAVEIPLGITVADWALPDPREFATFLDLVQSPETLALKYGVPMWSEKHWALVDRSLALMGELGCKAVYLPLLRRTDFGDSQSMVFWTRLPDGRLKHDIGVAEKYLDAAVGRLGKVPVVCLYAWHSETGGAYFGGAQHVSIENAGMPITLRDPATGALSEGTGPGWGTPEVREFWKPVFDDLRVALAKRGLAGSMMVGVATDMRPGKPAVEDLRAVAPDAKWAVACHPFTARIGDVPVGYLAYVWGIACTPEPGTGERVFGWQNPEIHTAFPRYGCSIVGHSLRQHSAPAAYRLAMEAAITSPGKRHIRNPNRAAGGPEYLGAGLRGLGRLGADFWPAQTDSRGRTSPIHQRYPKKGDHAVNLQYSAYYLLQPGKDGPIGSARMEAMREGIQDCEARVFLEKILGDAAARGRLGPEPAARAQKVLDERTDAVVAARKGANTDSDNPGWQGFAASDWQGRSARLYAACAEAARLLGRQE